MRYVAYYNANGGMSDDYQGWRFIIAYTIPEFYNGYAPNECVTRFSFWLGASADTE